MIQVWDVSVEKFIIPGTRDAASFGPVRIADKSRQDASKYLAEMLNIAFRKELPEGYRFGAHWALLNMRWTDFNVNLQAKAAEALTQALTSAFPKVKEALSPRAMRRHNQSPV